MSRSFALLRVSTENALRAKKTSRTCICRTEHVSSRHLNGSSSSAGAFLMLAKQPTLRKESKNSFLTYSFFLYSKPQDDSCPRQSHREERRNLVLCIWTMKTQMRPTREGDEVGIVRVGQRPYLIQSTDRKQTQYRCKPT